MEMQEWRSGRDKAADAQRALSEALRQLGLPPQLYDGVRPLVMAMRGAAYVSLPAIRAEDAERLAEAIRLGALQNAHSATPGPREHGAGRA